MEHAADEARKLNQRRKRDLKKEAKKALSTNLQLQRNSDPKHQRCKTDQSNFIEQSVADDWSANVQRSTVSDPKTYGRQQQSAVLEKIASFAEAATFMCTVNKKDPQKKTETGAPKSKRSTKALNLLSTLLSGLNKDQTRTYATTLKNGIVLSKCKILMQDRKLRR